MKTFLLIIELLPAIVEAVKEAEKLVPLPGAGKAKLDFVLGLITDTVGDVSDAIGPISKVISRIVGLANATGVFGKAAK